MNLLDANVWFAGIWDGHRDHRRALEWRTAAADLCDVPGHADGGTSAVI
jgi:hypothetical protein